MISPALLTDDMARRIADRVILSRLGSAIREKLAEEIAEQIAEETKPWPHAEFFETLFKALAPHEKKFKAMIQAVWEDERKIIEANLKKLKKSWLKKDDAEKIAESVLYPKAQFVQRIITDSTEISVVLMEERAESEIARFGLDVAFDVQNPEVQRWLESYYPKLSENLEQLNIYELKRVLAEGIRNGESIDQLKSRVYELYKDWGFRRAEMIARSETLRASNRGALETYRQSGVVEKKIWITHFDGRQCEDCEAMDGKVIGLDEAFDENDYETVETPPLHPDCRCAVGAFFEE